MWIYGILGAVTGITNDAALSYYKIVAPHLISGLNIFNALMSIMIAYVIVGVIDGLFTEFYLFNTPNGYANAYYIATVIYVIASVLLLVLFAKKHNRILDDEKK
ncbi:MFS transporter [Lactobacillus amylovorus]|nr:MFS transporter [Lactobacillus amylovorus]